MQTHRLMLTRRECDWVVLVQRVLDCHQESDGNQGGSEHHFRSWRGMNPHHAEDNVENMNEPGTAGLSAR